MRVNETLYLKLLKQILKLKDMRKYSIEDLLINYKGRFLKIDRVQGEIVFCTDTRGKHYYGLKKEQAKQLLIRKALPVCLGIKLEQIMK